MHQREINLLREYLSENKITKLYRDSDRSIQLEMRATILPKLTSILHGLHQQHFSFGSVAAMAKRWLYSQLIDPFLWPDECTELLVAALYLKQDPTLQPQAGFLRFLHYLANTDWSKELVLLNFNEEIPDEKVEELEKQFIDRRDNFPPLAIVTSCDADKFGLLAKAAPTQEVLNRVVMLAKVVITQIEENFSLVRSKVHVRRQITKQQSNTQQKFILLDLLPTLLHRVRPDHQVEHPPATVRRYNPRRQLHTGTAYERERRRRARINPGLQPGRMLSGGAARRLPQVRPLLLRPLRGRSDCGALETGRDRGEAVYGRVGLTGCVIGMLLKIIWFCFLQISNVSGRIISGKDVLQLNKEALVRDFEIVGKGLVASIERNN